MILVHRLRGEPFFLNADLIQTIETMPDTVITLIDARRIVVSDDPGDVVERVRQYRGSLLATAEHVLRSDHVPFTVIEGGEA